MATALRHHHILFRIQETSHLTEVHCAAFRRTIAENREIVAQSIDTILSAKVAMRRADEVLGPNSVRARRSATASFLEAARRRASASQDRQTSGLPSGEERMNHHELSEEDWKQHFAARLAALFMSHGLNESAALADAWAHADIRYPARTKATPEGEAEAEHAALEVEAAWT